MTARREGSHLLALAVAALCLTGCSTAQDVADATDPETTSSTTDTSPTEVTSETPTASAPTTRKPTKDPKPNLAKRPVVGNCYDTGRKAFANQRDGSFPVPCAKKHTAETFAVFTGGAVPRARTIDRVWRECQPKFKAYVGASPTVSTLGLTVILPSTAQTDAGQGWIRCDVIQQPSYNGNRGVTRSGSVKGILAGEVPLRFRGCALHWPKPSQPVIFTSCRHSHQAELIPESQTRGPPDAPCPGVQSTQSSSASFCESTFQDYVTETLNFYYYYPTRSSWQSGSHDTTCWALDLQGDGLPPI